MAEGNQATIAVEQGETQELVVRMTAQKGGHEVVITRVLDAPRNLVYQAMTDPSLIQRWWGPKELVNEVEKFEARPGGLWRVVQRDPNGKEYGFHGVFHEAMPDERLIYTFEYEGTPGHVALQIDSLEDHDTKTQVNSIVVFQTPEDRDGMLASGMERGTRESMERLMDLLDELQEPESDKPPAGQ